MGRPSLLLLYDSSGTIPFSYRLSELVPTIFLMNPHQNFNDPYKEKLISSDPTLEVFSSPTQGNK